MQLGFVIDHSRCIGCHACTVACKSENQVPLGSFRTWVKYTEEGEFPAVKRSFAVLRCNQCTAAPCVTICPTMALQKRPDGIVDVDPAACIGCKSCMHGCPYDALYIHPDKGTAEKCHFCAHRAEQGLAPACAIVCPTEAIIPGDFDDPESAVSRLKHSLELSARKPEAGTGPNVLYREVAAAGIDPGRTSDAGGHLWAARHAAIALEPREFDALESQARARTTYDVAHPPLWGWKISAYLLTKALAAGVFLVAYLDWRSPFRGGGQCVRAAALGVPVLALLFLALTALLLVLDLKRPERFLYILLRPNWSSWLVRGTWFLLGYGALLALWLVLGLAGGLAGALARNLLGGVTALFAAASAAYTGWLFAQAKGRVLWMQQGLWLRLVLQAATAGAGLLLALGPYLGFEADQTRSYSGILLVTLGLCLFYTVFEHRQAPRGREQEYARTLALLKRGPFAREHALGGLLLGTIVPILLLVFGGELGMQLSGVLALLGLWFEKSLLVRAGQALPIS